MGRNHDGIGVGQKRQNGWGQKKVVHKKAAPNPTAIIFALCNRAPGEWSNKHIQELTGKVDVENKPSISLANVPDDLLAQVIESIKPEW